MFLYVLLAACFVNTLAIDYLDNETVIIRRSPGEGGALFGYSAVLHSINATGGIDNTRYIRWHILLLHIPIVLCVACMIW